jgi:hypothetical protein
LNKFQLETRLIQELQIEVYANTVATSISIFFKRAIKPTLDEKFEEDKIIEFQMKGCKEIQTSLAKKEAQQPPKRGFLSTRPLGKQVEQNIEKESVYMESLQRMIKKYSNEIVDMKRNEGEGTSNQRPYRPFFRNPPPYNAIKPIPLNMNIDLVYVALYSFFTYHQENHSEKDFPQWVNAMNLMANHFLERCSMIEKLGDKASNTTKDESSEPLEQTTMVLWDINHMMSFDDLTKEEELPTKVLVMQTRSKGHITQNQPIISHAPKKPNNTTSLAKTTPIHSSAPKFPTQEVSKLEYNVVETSKR